MNFEINFDQMTYHLVLLSAAYVLALPVAWNREKGASRSAGLRTFPLVAMASCGYMLVGMSVLTTTGAEARIIYGIITGMGFIGGGAILKGKDGVTGTATAASLWNTGAIGVAVAFTRFEIAIVLSALNYLTLQFIPMIKDEEKDT